ncbi:MAG: hypothetical protein ACFFDV_07310 [Candidatus Thorarchaeota archaeon]
MTPKEEDCEEKVIITIFPPILGIGIQELDPIVESADACGDDFSPNLISTDVSPDSVIVTLDTENPMEKISQLIEQAQMKYGEQICIRWANYKSPDSTHDAIMWLNAALRGSGNTSVLDEPGFARFIGASAPVISINNRLSFVGIVPTDGQFLARIKASLRT